MHFSQLMWFHLKYDEKENRALCLYLTAILLNFDLVKSLNGALQKMHFNLYLLFVYFIGAKILLKTLPKILEYVLLDKINYLHNKLEKYLKRQLNDKFAIIPRQD